MLAKKGKVVYNIALDIKLSIEEGQKVFASILNQMIFLFSFIVIGYIFAKTKLISEAAAGVLSRLENMLFMPALVMGTFIKNFTIENLAITWKLILLSFGVLFIVIPLAILLSKVCFRDKYRQNIATYGLCFSNFAFMGNAIVMALFPDFFFEYIIFTLPLWIVIYLWGVPSLLISSANSLVKQNLAKRLKTMINPMFVGMIIGMVIGITGLGKAFVAGGVLENNIGKLITVAGDCMSPIAMLLTGLTIGKLDLLALIKNWRIYLISVMRLVVVPLLFVLVFAFVPHGKIFSDEFLVCAMCSISMPLGLNAIVVPAAYGKDTTDAAGMALISHLLSIITIPLLFMLFQAVVL